LGDCCWFINIFQRSFGTLGTPLISSLLWWWWWWWWWALRGTIWFIHHNNDFSWNLDTLRWLSSVTNIEKAWWKKTLHGDHEILFGKGRVWLRDRIVSRDHTPQFHHFKFYFILF
jgi:hypothetical protein